MATCTEPTFSRRKLFWSTQLPESEESCGAQCGVPRLECEQTENGATISTANWIRGLVINMLMTDGRQFDTECGFRPGSQGGHWSSSFIQDGPSEIGTLLRTSETFGRTQEMVKAAIVYVQSTMERIVARGVAEKVDVTGEYIGNGRIKIDIEVIGGANVTSGRVGLIGQSSSNGWVWN